MRHSLRRSLALAITAFALALPAVATTDAPGCEGLTPRACLDLAIAAMGGRSRLEAVSHIEWQGLGHTLLMEQSYRQSLPRTSATTNGWTSPANACAASRH